MKAGSHKTQIERLERQAGAKGYYRHGGGQAHRRQTTRKTNTQASRQTDNRTGGLTNRQACIQKGRQTSKKVKTDRQAKKQKEKHKDRRTHRQSLDTYTRNYIGR